MAKIRNLEEKCERLSAEGTEAKVRNLEQSLSLKQGELEKARQAHRGKFRIDRKKLSLESESNTVICPCRGRRAC